MEDGMRADGTESLTLTVEEAATRLGISRTLAYELANADRLPAPVLRLGRRLVISRLALERVLDGEARAARKERDGSGNDAA